MTVIGVVLIVLAAVMAIGIGIGLPLYLTIQGIWRNAHLPPAA